MKNELKDIAPFLSRMDKQEEGFKTPHLYFETLQDKVLTKVREVPETENAFTRFFKTLLQPRAALVLTSALALLIVTTVLLKPSGNGETDALASITTDELSAYLDENIGDFDLDILLDNTSAILDFSDGMNFELNELEEYIDDDFLDGLEDNTLEDLL